MARIQAEDFAARIIHVVVQMNGELGNSARKSGVAVAKYVDINGVCAGGVQAAATGLGEACFDPAN